MQNELVAYVIVLNYCFWVALSVFNTIQPKEAIFPPFQIIFAELSGVLFPTVSF